MLAGESIYAVLAEAKRSGLPFERAWYRAMEGLKADRSMPLALRNALDEERDIIRECKPGWQAAYEGRELTAEEWERMEVAAGKRLDLSRA